MPPAWPLIVTPASMSSAPIERLIASAMITANRGIHRKMGLR